jgi:hypothetical protein
MRLTHFVARVDSSAGGSGSNLVNGAPQWNGHFSGELLGVVVDYHASASAGTDLTITEISGLGRTLVNLVDTNTDTNLYPVQQATTNTGSAITGVYNPVYVDSGNLAINISGVGSALIPAVTVTVAVLLRE